MIKRTIELIKNFTFKLVYLDKLFEDDERLYFKVGYKEYFGLFLKNEIVFVTKDFSSCYSFVGDNEKFKTQYISYYVQEKIKNYERQ